MAVKRVQRTETLPLRPDGSVRLAVVADTHSLPHEKTQRWLKARKPDAILHAGDIGDLSVLDELRRVAPVYAVRGNIDTHAGQLPDVLTLDLTRDGSGVFRMTLLHIGVAGPRIRADARATALKARSSLLICGHSHVPFMGQEGALTVFNPGSVGPRRFMLPIVFGWMELSPAGLHLSHVDVETGQPWLPPGLSSATPGPASR